MNHENKLLNLSSISVYVRLTSGVSTIVVIKSEFFSAGFTEEAEEAETDGTGVNLNKSEHLLITDECRVSLFIPCYLFSLCLYSVIF